MLSVDKLKTKIYNKVATSKRFSWIARLYLRAQHVFHNRKYLLQPKENFTVSPWGFIEKSRVDAVIDMLNDRKSKKVYNNYFDKRIRMSRDYTGIKELIDNQYIIYELDLGSAAPLAIVDAGAFYGDTISRFRKLIPEHLAGGKIFAFEADPETFQQLTATVGELNGDCEIIPVNKALYSKNATISFSNAQPPGGRHVSEGGGIQVETIKLDDFIDEEITFIKMDIEGAEMEALKGAKRIIKQYKPKLAISIYHKPDDIWEIPMYVKELVPEYKLYVRHHSAIYVDLLLYATL